MYLLIQGSGWLYQARHLKYDFISECNTTLLAENNLHRPMMANYFQLHSIPTLAISSDSFLTHWVNSHNMVKSGEIKDYGRTTAIYSLAASSAVIMQYFIIKKIQSTSG